MPTFEKTIFTNQGIEFLNDLNSGRIKLISATAIYSTSDLSGMSDDDIRNMTDIQNKDISVPCDIIKLDARQTKFRSVANNEKLSSGIYIRSYATFFNDDAGHQTLFAIKVNTKPQYLVGFDGVNTNSQSYGFNVGISQTDNIVFTKLSNLAVTHEELDSALSSKADTSAIDAIKSDVGNVSSAIANNSGIATSFENVNNSISNNASSIAVMQNRISTNASSIAANSNNINILNSSVASNSSAISGLKSSVNNNATSIATNSTDIASVASAASNNTVNIQSLKSSVDSAYQNAVNTAKSYTDGINPRLYSNKSDALSYANSATNPAFVLYPNESQSGKVVDLLGFYTYGSNIWQDISLPIIASEGVNIDGVTAMYNQVKHVITMQGNATFNTTLPAGSPFITISIKSLGMNDINTNFGNLATANMDSNRENIVYRLTFSGKNYPFNGDLINLKYINNLNPNIPSWVPNNATIVTSGNLNDYYGNTGVFYAPQGNTISNTPASRSYNANVTVNNLSGDAFVFTGGQSVNGNAIEVYYNSTNSYWWRDNNQWNNGISSNFKNRI